MLKIAVIGLGGRGNMYARRFNESGAKVVAICEKKQSILGFMAKKYNIAPEMAFQSDAEFFAAGKLADAIVIATQDRDHYGHALSALNLGYDVLCEKPVSPFMEQCVELEKLAREKGLKMVVCHVLRYAPYYDKIKQLIDSGVIGEVTNINQTENVGYWHFSHSYVRGNWRCEAETGPSILAKCCHDLDLMYYFTGKKCVRVYSTGSRREFLPQNAPEGAADRCLQGCPHRKTCPYDVRKLYYGVTLHTVPMLLGRGSLITGKGNPSHKEIVEALKNTSPYGRCVYKCDNDVMENQVVSMRMEDGTNCTLTMTAQSYACYRRTHVCGTKGEIFGTDISGKLTLNIFGGKRKKIRIKMGIGHLGGDSGIVNDFIALLENGNVTKRISFMSETLESHKIAFAAEESRKSGKAIEL